MAAAQTATKTVFQGLGRSGIVPKFSFLKRAKKALSRFLTYDIDNGIPLGLVTFAKIARQVDDIREV